MLETCSVGRAGIAASQPKPFCGHQEADAIAKAKRAELCAAHQSMIFTSFLMIYEAVCMCLFAGRTRNAVVNYGVHSKNKKQWENSNLELKFAAWEHQSSKCPNSLGCAEDIPPPQDYRLSTTRKRRQGNGLHHPIQLVGINNLHMVVVHGIGHAKIDDQLTFTFRNTY